MTLKVFADFAIRTDGHLLVVLKADGVRPVSRRDIAAEHALEVTPCVRLVAQVVQGDAHDRAVDGLLQQVKSQEMEAGLDSRLGVADLLLVREQVPQGLDGQLVQALSLGREQTDYWGQIQPAPLGLWKQPTDCGRSCFGSHRTTSGNSTVNAMVMKNTM